MINITFPDGSVRQYEAGVTGYDIAMGISPRLAEQVLAVQVKYPTEPETSRGTTIDLTRPITEDCAVRLLKWEDDEAKKVFWHSSSHLMAEALEALFPGVKFGIGPAIENGFYYDVDMNGRTLTDADFKAIENKMLEFARQKQDFQRIEVSKADALKYFTEKGDPYKQELISELEDGTITYYTNGQFTDLCRGPHLKNTEVIKAVKVLSLAGAYWRGDEKRQQLTRIYGITFPKASMLTEYLQVLEEAKKRDHRKIGKDMELFTFSQRVGAGLPLWLPRGAALRNTLQAFLAKKQAEYGYLPVVTPHIGGKELYVTSGHYAKYGKDSFQPIHTPQEGEEYLLKPMNCPHHCEIYRSAPHSYRDLPIRIGEIAHDFRFEPSGTLKGIERGRHFCQNDAHLFVTPEQIKDEVSSVVDLIFDVYKDFGITNYRCVLSLRDPEDKVKYHQDDEMWERAENALREVLTELKIDFTEEIGEAAFYGPKLDVNVQPAIGAEYTLSTCQLDFCLPSKFNLTYVDKDGTNKTPVVLHRAILGSLDRFMAYLIEETKGIFPLWLSPLQVKVLPVSEKSNDYAETVYKTLRDRGIRAELDDRNEKIGYKIRSARQEDKVPYMIIIGEKEVAEGNISVRARATDQTETYSLTDFIAKLDQEIRDRVR